MLTPPPPADPTAYHTVRAPTIQMPSEPPRTSNPWPKFDKYSREMEIFSKEDTVMILRVCEYLYEFV